MAASNAGGRAAACDRDESSTKNERYRPRCSYSEDGASRFCANVNASAKTSESESEKPKIPDEKFGYGLYPERFGDKYKPSWFSIIFRGGGREDYEKMKCERKVFECIQTSPLVRLMFAALKSHGCEIDIRRHISCEVCDTSVTGGYDTETNQVIVCQNTCGSKGLVQGVLTHELIHMFDYCRAEMDFTNVRHLACSEIRAANLCHCSFMSAWMSGTASPFNIAKRHPECVKDKAMASIMAVRRMTRAEARAVVDDVFEKCYNDLEPFGRRIRRGTRDMERAYEDRHMMGYGDP